VPEVWIDIHEWGGIFLDLGEPEGIVGYPGKTRSEILEEFPNYILPEGIAEEGWWSRDLEDRATFTARAIRVADALQERAQVKADERIAIVTHAGFSAFLMKALFRHLTEPDILWYHHYNTAFARIDLVSNEPLHLYYLNRADHLPPEMVT
jgi:broad specificity phosphatase PhoE